MVIIFMVSDIVATLYGAAGIYMLARAGFPCFGRPARMLWWATPVYAVVGAVLCALAPALGRMSYVLTF